MCLCSGQCCRGPPEEQEQEPDADWERRREDEGRAYQEWDEDADIDESGRSPAEDIRTEGLSPRSLTVRGAGEKRYEAPEVRFTGAAML